MMYGGWRNTVGSLGQKSDRMSTVLQRLEQVLERFQPPSRVEDDTGTDIDDQSCYFTANDVPGMFPHSASSLRLMAQ